MNVPRQADWYEGTLTSIFDHEIVVQAFDGVGLSRPGPAHRNYPASVAWDLPLGGSVQIWFGGGLEVHFVLTSGACDRFVEVVRRRWSHRVSRADIAMDFDFPGAFEALYKPLDQLAQDQTPNKVKTSTAGDWLRAENGRTLYLGSFKSRWLGRIYEKGHEQMAKHPDQTFSLDWVRVEAQVRPQTSAHKLALSTMTSDEIFASTAYGAAVLAHLTGLGHTPLPLKRTPSTQPLFWMVQQYGLALRELVLEDPGITVAGLLARVAERTFA